MNDGSVIVRPKTEANSLIALARRVGRREERIDRLVTSCLKIAGQSVLLAMDQGDDLLVAKNNLPHGAWLPWLQVNFPKTGETARKYMSLAEKRRELGSDFFRSARTIEDAFKLLGILPPTETKQISGPSDCASPIIQRLNFVNEFIAKEAEAIKSWPEQQRVELKQRLRPMVDFYERL